MWPLWFDQCLSFFHPTRSLTLSLRLYSHWCGTRRGQRSSVMWFGCLIHTDMLPKLLRTNAWRHGICHTHTKTQALIRRELHVRISAVASLEEFVLAANTYIRKVNTHIRLTKARLCNVSFSFLFTCWLLIIASLNKSERTNYSPVRPSFPSTLPLLCSNKSSPLSPWEMFSTHMVIQQRGKQVYGFPAIQPEREPFHNKR